MEYSLQQLNKITNLNNLTITSFIENLNIIGLEIDEIIFENLNNKTTLNDIRVEIKIPANRDDLLIENVFLDELSTIFLFKIYQLWSQLKSKYSFLLKKQYLNFSNFSTIPIKSDLDLFLTYIIKVDHYKEIKLPIWIKKKLNLNEQSNNNLIENLIKLVIFEWGQNFNSLNNVSNNFHIEHLEKSQNIQINDQIYFLPSGSILLKNSQNKIISVLGILNHISNDKNIILEANFYDIDKNLLKLNDINTNLSFRYLRKCLLTNFKSSFQRLLTLLEIICDAKINPTVYKTEKQKIELQPYKLVKVNKNSFKKFLNIAEYNPVIFEKTNIKLVCSTLSVFYFRIPDFRKDLSREIDIIEEYTRFIGYKNFKEILPEYLDKKNNKKNKNKEFIKQFFINSNFTEIFTNSLISETQSNNSSISLKNPLNRDLSLLRSSLVGNLMDVFLKNLKFGINSLKFFEIGRIYLKENNKIFEQEHLCCIFPINSSQIISNNKLDLFIAKGFIENFLSYFSSKNLTFEKEIKLLNYYHPEKTLKILEGGKVVGYFGEIHPKYKKLNSLKQNIYLFEFNLNFLKSKSLNSKLKLYKEYSKYPLISKDLSITINKTTNFYGLKQFIKNSIEDLKNIQFFDIYFDDNLLTEISLGIRLEFQSYSKTLLNEEIESRINKLINLLKENYKINLKV